MPIKRQHPGQGADPLRPAMKQFKRLKPAFWDHKVTAGPDPEGHTLFNFRRKWKLLVLLTSFMALLPLLVMTIVEFNLTRSVIEQEIEAGMSRTIASAAAAFSDSIDREKAVMSQLSTVADGTADSLPQRLGALPLYNQHVVHLSLATSDGRLLYEKGPLAGIPLPVLTGKAISHSRYPAFYSDIYIHQTTGIAYLVLSSATHTGGAVATFILDMDVLTQSLAIGSPGNHQDLFVLDNTGGLVTPSAYFGAPGTDGVVAPALFENDKGVAILDNLPHGRMITGYAKLPDFPLTFVVVTPHQEVADLWFKPRIKLAGYLGISIILILLSIMGMATYLINRIHTADRKRVQALHHAEYANRLASIGRLASGVAHEINNPLAIISQKTGLIMDLFTLKETVAPDERLLPLANDVQDAVDRCGSITRRLLDFARHMEPSIEQVNIGDVLNQVLAFLEKEADRREIEITVNSKLIPTFTCDKGSLQQIFLNLAENAFAAMEDGGRLEISMETRRDKMLVIAFSDNGHGIPQEDIPKIFEPFYTSRNDKWGKGLGLSTTYGLIKELGGDITVKSRVNKGTCLTLTLPLAPVAQAAAAPHEEEPL